MPFKQNTLDLYTEGNFFRELIIQTIKEDGNRLAYEDVRGLLREQREAITRGEDPFEIRQRYEEEWKRIKRKTSHMLILR